MESWRHEIGVLETMLRHRAYTQIRCLLHGEDPLLLCSCRDAKQELTFVFVCSEQKVGVRTLRKMRHECAAGNVTHLIVLTSDGLTPFALRELMDADGGSDIEIFKKRELCMPITQHCLVPRHEPLTQSQKRQLLQDLQCKQSALPKLKESDPVARYLHLQAGTVVRITRHIGTLEAEPYFRVVV